MIKGLGIFVSPELGAADAEGTVLLTSGSILAALGFGITIRRAVSCSIIQLWLNQDEVCK
jgi:hypothetical protein